MRYRKVSLGLVMGIFLAASCQPEQTKEVKAVAVKKAASCCTKPIPSRLSQIRRASGNAISNFNLPENTIEINKQKGS